MSDSELGETPLDQLQAKHRKEKKELQAKVQILKKSKGDKKKKKEVTEEITKLESDLASRHAQELAELKPSQDNPPSVNAEDATVPGEVDQLSDSLQHTKLSKAQRRREKKDQEARERQQRIKEQEKENVHGERHNETELIKTKLKDKELMIYDIPSDGNCLYNAVLHQHGVATLQELRSTVASHMLSKPEEYLPYLTSATHDAMTGEEFQKYCEAIENTPAWGGQVEVRALTHTIRRPIRIIQAEGPELLLGEEYVDGTPLTLTYHRHMYRLGAHYNSVTPLLEATDDF